MVRLTIDPERWGPDSREAMLALGEALPIAGKEPAPAHRTAPTREAAVVRAILAYLNALPGCRAEKVHASPYGNTQVDILACYHGRMLQLECKRPGAAGTATARQLACLRDWARAGAVTGVVTSVDDVKALLAKELGNDV